MFFEEGWVPLSDATTEVFRILQSLQAAGKIPQGQGGLKTVLAISVWDICDACSKIGATGPDGSVISASKELVAWADPRELSNEHLDMTVGSIGSSGFRDEAGNRPSRDDMLDRYGPFLSLPVVLPVNNYQSSLTFLEEEVTKFDPEDEEMLTAAKSIIGMVDGGETVTREVARAKLGAALSRRKFKLAWALASQHRKDLAAPNRWQGL